MTNVGLSSLATKQFDVLVCGFEEISTSEGNEITQSIDINSGKVTIDFASKFVSSDPVDCPIQTIGIFKDALGENPE